MTDHNRRFTDNLPDAPLQWDGIPTASEIVIERQQAAINAGVALLKATGTDAAAVLIPGDLAQYVAVGDREGIAKVLELAAPSANKAAAVDLTSLTRYEPSDGGMFQNNISGEYVEYQEVKQLVEAAINVIGNTRAAPAAQPDARSEVLNELHALFRTRAWTDREGSWDDALVAVQEEIAGRCQVARAATTTSQPDREGFWTWEQRAEAAEAFMRNYADANMEKLLGDYEVQPIIRRLAAAILEWQKDAIKHAPEGCAEAATTSQPDEARDAALREAVAEGLRGLYGCGRVWSAWSVGTMGEDDFYAADESDECIDQVLHFIAPFVAPTTASPSHPDPELQKDGGLFDLATREVLVDVLGAILAKNPDLAYEKLRSLLVDDVAGSSHPVQQQEQVQTIPLLNEANALLKRDGEVWALMRGPSLIRYLDKFEGNFVNSAIAAQKGK